MENSEETGVSYIGARVDMADSQAPLDPMVKLDIRQIDPLLIPLDRDVIDPLVVIIMGLVTDGGDHMDWFIQFFPDHAPGSIQRAGDVCVGRDLRHARLFPCDHTIIGNTCCHMQGNIDPHGWKI